MNKKIKYYSLLLLFLLTQGYITAQNVIENKGVKILEKTIVLKSKTSSRDFLEGNVFSNSFLGQVLDKIGVYEFKRKFPYHEEPFGYGDNPLADKMVDLSLIYQLSYKENYDEYLVVDWLLATKLFEYVEVKVVHDLLYTPNDPDHASQYHLAQIKAYEAWDIEKGDTNVVIGITDTGTNLTHADLQSNLKYNYNDPIDGIDNDGDGYVDNFHGWDLAENDNDPTWQSNKHGVSVAGCAVATVDNADQGAAIGFKTKYLPVKISNSSGSLTRGYEGIIYAADHGCSIINCSWGSQGGKTNLGQDVINYATYNKGALVVAAAGNNNNDKYFYPASYQNVLSVGGVDPSDERWQSSSSWGTNYNSAVDVVAPALSIYTTSKNLSGVIGSGTSFASPMAAGTAALVKAKYPNYLPQQIAGLVALNSDNIYSVGSNSTYAGKMGFGRLNAEKALKFDNKPYIQFLDYSATDGVENNFVAGDTIEISLEFINYLQKSSIGSVKLTTSNTNVKIINSTSVLKSLDILEKGFANDRLKVAVISTTSTNESVEFNLEITADGITWYDNFYININRDYIDVLDNDIDFSFNNYGRIGYTYSGAGLGVRYKGENLISTMGVVLGNNKDTVLSYEDFELLGFGEAKVVTTNTVADKEVVGSFDDQWAPKPIGVNIKQHAYVWKSAADSKYVIYEYTVYNPTGNTYSNLHLGLYGDWDIGKSDKNIGGYEDVMKLGYVYESGGNYGAIKAIRSSNSHYYAFNKDGSNGSINISDGFKDDEEYQSLSSGVQRKKADLGDVSQMVAHGPFDLKSGDSITLAFAVLAASNLDDLKSAALAAEVKYESFRGIQMNLKSFSNVSCKGKSDGEIGVNVITPFKPYTMEWLHDKSEKSTELSSLNSGIYQLSVTDRNGVNKLLSFTLSEPDSLKVSIDKNITTVNCKGDSAQVNVSATGGTSGYNYKWDNVLVPGISNPKLPSGNYQVVVSDARGCSDSVTVKVNEPKELQIFTDVLKKDSTNKCKGIIETRILGGTSPFNYSWVNQSFPNSNIAVDLCKGDYVLQVTDANGCSAQKSFKIEGGPNGIADELKIDQFNLYPNPAKDLLVVTYSSQDPLNYQIVNVIGERMNSGVLYNNNKTPNNIDVNQLSSGVYFIVFQVKDKTRVVKFTISK